MKKLIIYILAVVMLIIMAGCTSIKADELETEADKNEDDGLPYYHDFGYAPYAFKGLYVEDIFPMVTDVVKAKFLYMKAADEHVAKLYFERIDTVHGDIDDGIIEVVCPVLVQLIVNDTEVSGGPFGYINGRNYMVLLREYEDPYNGAIFTFPIWCFNIPLDSENNCNFYSPNALFVGEKIVDKLSKEETATAISQGKFEEYLLEQIKYNPSVNKDYKSNVTDIVDVINEAECVFVGTVGSEHEEIGFNHKNACVMINKILKGSLDDKSINDHLSLILPMDATSGSLYIIAVSRDKDKNYIMTAKNSVFSVSQEDEILEILNKQ